MSNKKVKGALLEGYEGPFFPRSLERIQKRFAYETVRWNKILFDDVADALHDGEHFGHITTSDGYVWADGISFMLHKTKFMVLFPMALDTNERIDGTQADRHVALYSSVVVHPKDLDRAADVVASDLVATYRYLYSNAIRDGKKLNGIPVAE